LLIENNTPDKDMPEDGDFGWEFFTAASKEAKKSYMLSTLVSNIPYQYTDIFRFILQEMGHEEAASSIAYRTVDHQSKIYLPSLTTKKSMVCMEFFKE
jgi:hypothetical protein